MIGLGEGVWSWRIEGGSIVYQLLFCSTMVLIFSEYCFLAPTS